MSYSEIINTFGNSVYFVQGLIAVYGAFLVILMLRRISRKRFANAASATQFLDEIRDRLNERNVDGIIELCDSPAYWSKAVPQLILIALQNPHLSMAKLRRLLGETFEREVLAEFEFQTSWIATVVKSAPMLGLLGTVLGMIAAFEKIANVQQTGTDPSMLAGDISYALITTAVGLIIAIPLVLAGNMLHVRIGKLQDSVQQYLGQFLEIYENSPVRANQVVS
ncbi:MAG: MotA/TolQ/ExbB proton channel family protein [Planctomycetaceae bacterium]